MKRAESSPSSRFRTPAARGGARAGRGAGIVGRHAEVPEDPANDGRLLNERAQPQPPAAPRTRHHVEPKRAQFGLANSIDCWNEYELLVGEMTNWRVQKVTLKR